MTLSPLLRRCAAACVLTLALTAAGCRESADAKCAKFLASGRQLLEKGDVKRALLQFRNALRVSPKSAEAHYQLGMAFAAAGDYGSAVAAYRKAISLDPNHMGAKFRIAQMRAAATDQSILREARDELTDLMKSGSSGPGWTTGQVLNTLALTDIKLGDPASAAELIESAIGAGSAEFDSLLVLAEAKWQQRDFQGAEEVLKKAAAQLPKSAMAHTVLAEFYIGQKRFTDAEPELQTAIGLDPKAGRPRHDLARLQFTQGRKADAEKSFRELSAFDGYKPIYGVFLFQEGRRDDAVREFERVARENPDDQLARTYLLAAYRALNRSADIDRVFATALQRNPKDIAALNQRAEIYLERGQYQQAETDLNVVVRLAPATPEAHYLLSKVHRARGQMDICRDELNETLRRNPLALAARIELADLLVSANQAQAAVSALDAAPAFQQRSLEFLIARNWALWAKGDLSELRKGIDAGLARGKHPVVLLQDGMWKLRSRDVAGSRSSLEEALKLDRTNLQALQTLYGSYIAQNNRATGIQKLKDHAALAPDAAAIQDYLGAVLLENGDLAGARSAFTKAAASSAGSIEPELGLIKIDFAERKYADGRARVQKLLSTGRDNSAAYLWLAIFEEAAGEYPAAIGHLRNALAGRPNDAQAANNLAYLLAEQNSDLNEALKYAQKAVEIAPDMPAYADTMGWILYRKGLYTAALRYLQQAGANPGNALWKYHLAMAYAKAGDLRQGRAALATALKLNPNLPEAKLARELIRE